MIKISNNTGFIIKLASSIKLSLTLKLSKRLEVTHQQIKLKLFKKMWKILVIYDLIDIQYAYTVVTISFTPQSCQQKPWNWLLNVKSCSACNIGKLHQTTRKCIHLISTTDSGVTRFDTNNYASPRTLLSRHLELFSFNTAVLSLVSA